MPSELQHFRSEPGFCEIITIHPISELGALLVQESDADHVYVAL
jgi:hypothetical protein